MPTLFHCNMQTDAHTNANALGGYLPPTKEEVHVFVRVCLSVCLSVSMITQKTRAWIWMKCCVSTDVGTRTNWLTFEPDPQIIVRMPEPDCFLRYRIGYGTSQPWPGCQQAALLRGILRRRDPTYTYWRHGARASRGFKMVLFTEPSEHLCRRYMRSTVYRVLFSFFKSRRANM